MKLKLDYKDFLCDDLFVYWRTRRTVKLTQFWEDFINKNEHLRESFELAIATFDEIQKNKSECIIDEETVNRQLQDRIYHLKKSYGTRISELIIHTDSFSEIDRIPKIIISGIICFNIRQ